ncbi:MAG: ABC transporter ATP-binding protein, partial [Oscillospiraceae bacterium]|nr:ABC transporter ATP-binding protein [Oscillospiraceae bacterium]
MVELKHVCAAFEEGEVLHDISLSFPNGKVTVLLGPNGSGKSTLLRTILGFVDRTQGEILVDGVPLEGLSPREKAQRIAYLPQSRPVPNITARRMVLHGRFPYLGYPRRYRAEDNAAVDDAMKKADAADLAGRTLPQLSGGERQRVYLAMALAQSTEVILMDEPTTYLDVHHQLEVMALARRLAGEGKAVVLVLHDLCLALRCADLAAVLSAGRVKAFGTPEELYDSNVLN